MRCKNCREKFEPARFNMKYCLKDECVRVFVEKTKEKVWKDKVKKHKQGEKETWLKLARVTCHTYIRLRDKDKGCISCGKPLQTKNTDAGHMWSSGNHSYLRYNEFNINGQCSRPCNKDKAGDINNYRINFVKRYSQELLDELDQQAKKEKRYSIDDLKEVIEYFKKKTNELKLYQKE